MNLRVEDHVTEAVRTELALLTAGQVCDLLGVSKDWLYLQVRQGRFPAVRLGPRSVRFHPDAVREHIAALTTGGAA